MIRLNRWEAYGLGIVLSGLIYLIAQGTFFMGTSTAKGTICRIRENVYGNHGYSDFFYACFTARDSNTYQVEIGDNIGLSKGDPVSVIYKNGDPKQARMNDFKTLWVIPSFPYIIVWGIIMALLTGAFYGSRYMFIRWKPFRLWIEN